MTFLGHNDEFELDGIVHIAARTYSKYDKSCYTVGHMPTLVIVLLAQTSFPMHLVILEVFILHVRLAHSFHRGDTGLGICSADLGRLPNDRFGRSVVVFCLGGKDVHRSNTQCDGIC